MSRPLSGIAAERLVFVVGLCVVAVGAIGIVAPSGLAWIARRFTTPGQWNGLAAIRVEVLERFAEGLLGRVGRGVAIAAQAREREPIELRKIVVE